MGEGDFGNIIFMFFREIIVSLRPKQWIKNLFVLAAIIFVRQFDDPQKIYLAGAAFLLFCLSSGAIYIVNDIADLPADRLHPTKKNRPLAAGRLSVSAAAVTAGLLLIFSVTAGFYLNFLFGAALVGFIILNFLYSFTLKNVVILDVLAIAVGFVLRVVAGALAIGVVFSPWLVFCTFFLTLFLAVSKRKSELSVALAHNDFAGARPVLRQYSLEFIGQMNMIVLPLTLITYTFYTFSSEHSKLLMLTVPVVLYGLLRYLFILNRKDAMNDGPTDDFFTDIPLQITVAVWLLLAVMILIFQK